MKYLITALLDLANEIPEVFKSLYICGGLGLYIKQRQQEDQETVDTLILGELWPPARTTEDNDFLLPIELIINADATQQIREALDKLGYTSITEHFQFVKETDRGEIKIDLLAGSVPVEHQGSVKISTNRIRPLGYDKLHARHTAEAIALHESPLRVKLSGKRSDGTDDQLIVQMPNPFTYLLMKLHAFGDRVDDERKGFATHHAMDLYRIIAMLTQEEHQLVTRLCIEYQDTAPFETAKQIVGSDFNSTTSRGAIRLLTGARESDIEITLEQQDVLVGVLQEFFPNQT